MSIIEQHDNMNYRFLEAVYTLIERLEGFDETFDDELNHKVYVRLVKTYNAMADAYNAGRPCLTARNKVLEVVNLVTHAHPKRKLPLAPIFNAIAIR